MIKDDITTGREEQRRRGGEEVVRKAASVHVNETAAMEKKKEIAKTTGQPFLRLVN